MNCKNLKKKRILIVDDEPTIIEMVQIRLEVAGFDVLSAENGQEGLEKVRREKPDLVILDIMMPKMNGYQVCRELKKDEATKKIPVILFSAKSQESDKFWGEECGADAYILKPYEIEELLAKIHHLLKG